MSGTLPIVLTRSTDMLDGFPRVIGNVFTAETSNTVLSDPAPPVPRAFYRIEEAP